MSDKLNQYIRGYDSARVYAKTSEPGAIRDRWLSLADAYRVLIQAEKTLLREGASAAAVHAAEEQSR